MSHDRPLPKHPPPVIPWDEIAVVRHAFGRAAKRYSLTTLATILDDGTADHLAQEAAWEELRRRTKRSMP